ncbi:restriction endonuclease subunit S [Chryseobacterium oryctis]|uniref:Restriction endonuclease subunit S n=1 Tax=Chryseobacterium oryctis TaxID=2952618 RepID=A0ABT3HRU3_9FLAO|nr:restriction endonuclease subunit S [Chryseobacterium oryctis]MCW3162464.1 restriction endonuclease subunit S [Chryseobacterium oryctis]
MQMTIDRENTSSIKYVKFHDITMWDVKRYSSEKIKSDYPIVKLGTQIREESHRVKLSAFPEDDFGILGVSNKIGIFDAYQEKGKKINQPYKKMEIDWLAYNPYRINVGSIGMRTKEHSNKFISPAYVVFSCKESLLPDFLYKLFKTQRFNKIIKESTTGSVRQNLTFDILKSLDIALPPLNVQHALLASYYNKIDKAIIQENEARNKEQEINDFLLSVLDIKFGENKEKKALTFAKFSNIDRWAIDYLFNLDSIKGITEGKYPVKKVKSFLLSYQYGLSVKATEIPIGIPMLRMNNIYNSKLDLNDLKYIKLNDEQKSKVLLNKGDLLFNRTNSKELVGKTAIFDLDDEYTFASYLIRLKLNTEIVNVHYINYLFNSLIGRSQIDSISRQVLGQANVNAQELQDFVFPIPNLEIQEDIVSEINKIKLKAESLKQAAEINRINAINEFEEAIFKN